jgi:hypothetical protein
MEIFTELAHKPEPLEAVRARLGLHPRSAQDFLDTLVALGLLERREGIYYNTPAADFYLDKKKPSYIGGILEMANQRLYGHWAHLTEGLRTGLPQNEVRGGNAGEFEAIYADPARLKVFLKAMSGISRGSALAIATKFPFKDYKSVCDVGTAQGDTAAQIALAHPHLRAMGFDLPEVGPVFEDYMEELGLDGRVKFVGGSFFDQPLPNADVIVMGHILHDWDLETKKMLISKAYDALPKGGAYIVYEAIIDDDRSKNAFGLMMSLNMLVETRGGFDFTGADCQGWMREAGFSETRVEPLVAADSMVVGIK